VAEALHDRGVEARLKWPNDVRVGGRKIAGILAEGVSKQQVVLGIGVNVARAGLEAQGLTGESATSLERESGVTSDRHEVCAAVLTRLTVCYDAATLKGSAEIVERWQALSEPCWGRAVELRSAGGVTRGVAVGIEEDGGLVIEDENGRRRTWLAGDLIEQRRRTDGAE
jgi:BirA family biotin operon repressor/biotin-[acetyl-CoA-carboxylase] ligase